MYIKLYLIIIMVSVSFLSCNKNDEKSASSNDLKKKELELKEKELQLKEKEMMDKKEAELNEKEKQLGQKPVRNNIDLAGTYDGTIKDGTNWYVVISGFDGKSFKGYNEVFWKSTPDGYKTNFKGTYDEDTKEIIMYEDKYMKGSGKFIGTVSSDGNKMSGTWFRYSDNGSFTWELERIDKYKQ
jgi:hypothetical protein